MDKHQAQKIIKDTFERSFDMDRFTVFIRNLLNRIDESKAFHAHGYVKEGFRGIIKTYERVGTYNATDDKKVDIIVVYLQKGSSLDHARVTQRNFAGRYLDDRGEKDAGLFAFVSPDEADWRFSLVKMDYKFDKNGKVKEEFTPARRWSFLVGKNEKSHTAQIRLVKILADDEHAPTLAELEQAFDIETVTKEFFREYRNLFLRTKEELDNVVNKDPKIEADFQAKGVDTVNFAKKLLGQIIFLYFLQKKGWFGVGRDDNWGTGSKQFLRELFEKKHSDYNNFFNDILEPLFYEALRSGKDREHIDYYYSRFNCKIPFLNGGLFDPIGNYDWVHTDIIIPDTLFSNSEKTKEGDTGTGILDVFDRYNFTVKEDEPLEKEVAIDPELLGKAYEKFNAIRPDNYAEFKKALKSGRKGEENKFNKKFGVYYTPREIVHYMCQQSLINYLHTEVIASKAKQSLIPSKEDIEALIHTGEHVSENEARVISEGRETKTYSHQLPESIRKNAKLIDDKLAEITVCDPAVGSGAFPVGMMSEIVKTRNVLTPFLSLRGAQATKQSQFDDNRIVYNFKRQCIEHSLYGVDIDPGAVEIAKLRLWLSLVVDEEDIKNIKPLPNLDYRIMQGNSLISEFMGINFDDDKVKEGGGLFKDEADELIELFQQKKDEFLNESNVTRKSKVKEEVENLLIEIFETKLRTQKADYFNRLKDIENKYSILPNEKQRDEFIKKDKEKLYEEAGFNLESIEKQLREFTSGRQIKPFFLWDLYFSEVFHHKYGFDVVIANPPYGANIDRYTKKFEEKYPETTKSFKDIYKIFYELGLSKLVVLNGTLSFITPNTFLTQPRYKDLRKYLLKHTIQRIINLGENVFQAVVPTAVTIVAKTEPVSNSEFSFADLSVSSKYSGEIENITFASITQQTYINNYDYIFTAKSRGFPNTVPLDDMLAFKDAGINYQRVKVGLGEKGKSDLGNRLLYEGEKENTEDMKYWKGTDIAEYYIKPSTRRFVRMSTIHNLKNNERVILNAEYFSIIPKLIWRQTAQYPIAAVDKRGIWFGRSIQAATVKNAFKDKIALDYLAGLLNSKFMRWLYVQNVKETGRVFPQVKLANLRVLPIKLSDQKTQNEIGKIVYRIERLTQSESYHGNKLDYKELKNKIDQLVYKLYDLTPEEIKIVEGN